jgi:dipeptidyl aminopeptidase/acylaminoacyl peptidase
MTDSQPNRKGRNRRRSVAIVIAVAMAIVLGAGAVYAGGGYLAYQDLSVVQPGCGGRSYATQTPADFTITGTAVSPLPDVTPYRFTDATEVAFPTRDGDLTIRGWYAPPAQPDGPVVIVVHGFNSCRRDWNVLLPAGMLHKAGFGVLLPDLRNHGDSDIDNGRWAGGAKEYRDVLGGWDWLVAQGVSPERIGLLGMSLGAGTVAIAAGEESRVAATWADSSYDRYAVAAAEYAESRGYPAWVAGAAIPVGRLLGDAELAARDPGEEVTRLGGRPLFIVQGLSDTTVRPHNAVDLAIDAAQGGTLVEPWLIPEAEHTQEILLVTDRYEKRLIAFFSDSLGSP